MNKISIESATQLNKVLSFLPEEIKSNIPEYIWRQINDKIDKSIYTKINEVRDIKEKNLLPETRKYLAFIFINYLAKEEEKKEYTKIIKNNEEQYQKSLSKRYNVDDIFKKKKDLDVKKEYKEEINNLPIKYKKNFFVSILNKIKSLFRK